MSGLRRRTSTGQINKQKGKKKNHRKQSCHGGCLKAGAVFTFRPCEQQVISGVYTENRLGVALSYINTLKFAPPTVLGACYRVDDTPTNMTQHFRLYSSFSLIRFLHQQSLVAAYCSYKATVAVSA